MQPNFDQSNIYLSNCPIHKRELEFICAHPNCSLNPPLCPKCPLQDLHGDHLSDIVPLTSSSSEDTIRPCKSKDKCTDALTQISSINKIIKDSINELNLYKEQEIESMNQLLMGLASRFSGSPTNFVRATSSNGGMKAQLHPKNVERNLFLAKALTTAETTLYQIEHKEFDLARFIGYVSKEANVFDDPMLAFLGHNNDNTPIITLLKQTSQTTFIFLVESTLVCYDFIESKVKATLTLPDQYLTIQIHSIAPCEICAIILRSQFDDEQQVQQVSFNNEMHVISHASSKDQMSMRRLHRFREVELVVDLKKVPGTSQLCVLVENDQTKYDILLFNARSGRLVRKIISLNSTIYSLNLFRGYLHQDGQVYSCVLSVIVQSASLLYDVSTGFRLSQRKLNYDSGGMIYSDSMQVKDKKRGIIFVKTGFDTCWQQEGWNGDLIKLPWQSQFECLSLFAFGRVVPFVHKGMLVFYNPVERKIVKQCRMPEKILVNSHQIQRNNSSSNRNSSHSSSELVQGVEEIDLQGDDEHENRGGGQQQQQFELLYQSNARHDLHRRIAFLGEQRRVRRQRVLPDTRLTQKPIALLNHFEFVVMIYMNGTVQSMK